MSNTKIFHHVDGKSYTVDGNTCRGCWMNDNPEKLPIEVEPIWQNEDIIIRQDVEWPIPAFYIVSLRKHIGSIADISAETAKKLFEMIALVRRGMREVLKIERVQLYHEEKIINPHVHFWLLPLWQQKMDKYQINPKIYEGNVKTYIDLFKYCETKDDILMCNRLMKEYLDIHS